MSFLSFLANYLFHNLAFTLFLCLGFGCLLGKIRIRSFSIGATAGTLLLGLAIGLFITRFASIKIDDPMVDGTLKDLLFALFCFTIGFEVGPSFFTSLKSTGLKIIILAVFFAGVSLGIVVIFCQAFSLDEGTGAGLIAGALTQSAVIDVVSEEGETNAAVAYALTYVFGTIGLILFVKKIAPAILRKDLYTITKEKLDSLPEDVSAFEDGSPERIIQVRAYRIRGDSPFCDHTLEVAERFMDGNVEIEAVYRDDKLLHNLGKVVLQKNDVIQIIGDIVSLDRTDNAGLQEVSNAEYYQVKIVDAEIVLTDDFTETGKQILSHRGVLLRNPDSKRLFKKHSILSVTGSAKAIKAVAKQLGYLKYSGESSDVPFISIIAAAGIAIGAVSIDSFSLGSVAVLLVGMLAGWWYSRTPKIGYFPSPARWILKTIGLNLYIAAIALNVSGKLIRALTSLGGQIPLLVVLGAVITLIPHILSLLFGRYVLRIDNADLLGGLCGSGTCTAALNAMIEETNSSIFAMGYAPGSAAGNVLLVLIGIILQKLI